MKSLQRMLCLFFLLCLCLTSGCSLLSSTPTRQTASPTVPVQTAPVSPADSSAKTPTPSNTPTQTPSQPPAGTPGKTPIVTDKKIIALSFDDGPDFDTPGMLDVLDKHNVKATFFIVGSNLEYKPMHEILKRTAEAGHELGNHSYSHPSLRNYSDADFLAEISKTNNIIYEITGVTPVLFRPPSGIYTERQLAISNMSFVLWSVDSWDWYRIGTTPAETYAKEHNCTKEEAMNILADEILFEHGLGWDDIPAEPLINYLKHGAVFLFHDIHPGTAVLIDKFLTYIEQTGEYTVMTVSDMLSSIGTGPVPGKIYRSAWPQN